MVLKMLFSTYVNYLYDDLEFDDFVSILRNNPNENALKSELYNEYRDLSNDEIIALERRKLIYFILSYPQKLVLGDSLEKDKEKEFYGYEFSNRRGHEGIHIHKDDTGKIDSKMYDPLNLINNNKMNLYILRNFFEDESLEKDIENINSNDNNKLNGHLEYLRLSDLFNFNLNNFENIINLNKKKQLQLKSKYPNHKIANLLTTLESGKRESIVGTKKINSGIPSLGGQHIGLDGKINLSEMRFVSNEYFEKLKYGHIKKYDILICKDGALTGKIAFVDDDYPYDKSCINEHIFILRTESNKILQKYLFNFFFSNIGQKIIKTKISGAGQGGLNKEGINSIHIPLPPLKIQKEIIKEIDIISNNGNKNIKIIKNINDKIMTFISNIKGKSCKLKSIMKFEYGKALTEKDRIKGEYPVMGANGIIGYHNQYLIKGPSIIVGRKGSVGKINWIEENNTPIDTTFYVVENKEKIIKKYAYYMLKSLNLETLNTGRGSGGLNRETAYNQKIILPSVLEQKKIINKIKLLENDLNEANDYLLKSPIEKEKIIENYLF